MGTVTVDQSQSRIYWSVYLPSGAGDNWIRIEARFNAGRISDEDRALILDVIDYAKKEVELEREARGIKETQGTAVQG